MAAVTATIKDCVINSGTGATAMNGDVLRIEVEITCDNGATQVAGGTDTLDVVVNTVLQGKLQNGKTYTPRSFSVKQPARSSSTEYAATIANSSGTLQITPKSASDWSSNATISASAAVRPYTILVLCDVT